MNKHNINSLREQTGDCREEGLGVNKIDEGD